MYIRDLHEPQNERMEQAARAILAAVYNSITTQANWGDIQQLNPTAFDRLMRITALAVANWRAQTAPGEVPYEELALIDAMTFEPSADLLSLSEGKHGH
jgi:hypothetical protein